MAQDEGRYIPALNRQWLTPAFDWVLRTFFREGEFKPALVAQAASGGVRRVLDLGCGTGTLTLALANACAGASVLGLDGDQEVIDRARAKVAAAGLDNVSFVRAMSYALPFEAGSFDRVTASLMLHHLTRANKVQTLREALRVLRPGGQLHVADFGPPAGRYSRMVAPLARHLEEARENFDGELPSLILGAGFGQVARGRSFTTILGQIELLQVTKRSQARHSL